MNKTILRPLRVLCVMSSLGGGGAERQMVLILKHIERLAFVPTLCLLAAEGPFLAAVPSDVSVVGLGKRRASDAATVLVRLARQLRLMRPDVILAKSVYANELAVFATYAARTATPVVVGEESVQTAALPRLSHARFRRELLRWTYARAACVTAPTAGVLEDLILGVGVRPRTVAVIPNMVECHAIGEAARRREAHPFEMSPLPLLVSVGRLLPEKGWDDLLDALAQLIRARPCNLLILGDGPERARLQSVAASLGITSHVAFLGFVSNPFSIMRQADVFVSASHFESFGNVLIEAMAVGVPIVCTRVREGPISIIAEGETGLFARERDPVDLARQISYLLERPHERVRIANRAKSFVRRFDTSAVIPLYEATLTAAAGRTNSFQSVPAQS